MQYSFINAYMGGRTGTLDFLPLPSYNVEDIVLTLYKIDQAGSGQISANLIQLKPFGYDQMVEHVEQPNTFYPWLPPDNATTAHEQISGNPMTIAGAGAGIVGGNAGASRYASMFGMLHPSNSAQLVGGNFLQAAENAAQSWTLEFWIIRVLATLGATIYFETNAGNSQFLQITMSAAGLITITHNGVLAWTAPAAIAAGAWHHVMLVYNAGGATIQQFVDGVSSGAATAYTRVVGWVGVNTYWNFNANGQFYSALGAAYQNVIGTADMASRHFNDLITDSWPGASVTTGATIAAGFATGVVFSNTMTPGWDSTSQTLRQVLGSIVQVVTNNGVYAVQGTLRWKEGR